MLRVSLLFLVASQCLAQFPEHNIKYQSVKLKKLPDVKFPIARMAVAYEMLYGLTDENHFKDAYLATRDLTRFAKGAKLWSTVPKLDKKYLKDFALLDKHPYLTQLSAANLALHEALKSPDQEQVRQNLMRLYRAYPLHVSIRIAVARNLLEQGEIDIAEKYVTGLTEMEPMESQWPLLVLHAEYSRARNDFDSAMDSLAKAKKFTFSKNNPAQEMFLQWEKEVDAIDAPPLLFEMGAYKRLKKLRNESQEAHFLYARSHSDSVTRIRLIRSISKKYPENMEYLRCWLDLLAQAWPTARKTIEKMHAKHPQQAFLNHYASFNHKLEKEQRIHLLETALDEEPELLPAWESLAELYKSSNQHDAYLARLETLLEKAPSQALYADGLAYLARKMDDALAQSLLERAIKAYPHDLLVLENARDLLLAQGREGHEDSFDRIGYHLLSAGIQRVADFDFESGADMVALASPLFANFEGQIKLMAANFYYRARLEDIALPLYEQSLEHFPKKAFLHELLGDCLQADGKMKFAVAQYTRAQELDSNRPHLAPKIKDVQKRRKQKIGQELFTVLSMFAFMGGVANGGVNSFHVYYYPPSTQRSLAATSSIKNMADALLSEEQSGGYGIDETRPLLLGLYNHILDLEERLGN